MAHHDHDHDDGEVHAHVSPVSFYGLILGILFVFTGLTFLLSLFHLGAMNLLVAVLIATTKATLVILYFMHLRYDAKFNALLLVGALMFAGIFLAYTINDTNYRGIIDPVNGVHVDPTTGERALGGPPTYEPMIHAVPGHHGEGGDEAPESAHPSGNESGHGDGEH